MHADIQRTEDSIQGHNFMLSNEYEEPFERNDLRLRVKVPHRIRELKILMASLEYALVPDGFWMERGKILVETITGKAPEKAVEIAASWLRNPLRTE